MDTTVKYILMCRRARELQSSKKVSVGDFMSERDKSDVTFFVVDSAMLVVYSKNPEYLKTDIWLPRQDQIQDLLKEKGCYPKKVFDEFKTFFDENWSLFNTYDKLWLAFYMYTKYRKKWDSQTDEWKK